MSHTNNRPIAILLAAYNAEKYFKEQLDSLFLQTNTNWMLYIRNDGSTDSTQMIIDEYIQKYPDRVVQIDKGGVNLGCYANFFRLLQVVDSDYYMFCDSDDYWLPEKIQVSYDFLRKKETEYPTLPLLAHTDKSHADGNLNIIHKEVWVDSNLNPDDFVKFNYLPICIVGGACAIFNKKARDLSKTYPPIEGVAHDSWVALTTSKFGKIFAIRQATLVYRYHGNNTTLEMNQSRKSVSKKFLVIADIFKKFRANHKQINDSLGYGSFLKYVYYRFLVNYKLMLLQRKASK